MPLRALLGEKELVSIDLPPDTFESLRGQPDLRMACCETSAVPKRSVLGLPFFAHAKAGECSSAPETAFHLQGKAIMLRAARAAEWDAWVEVSGKTPSGERWRADVLCIHGKKRVAFELQHSGITLATLAARQARYRASHVRCFWFMSTHERRLAQAQPWQHDTPALYMNDKHHVPALDLSLGQTVEAALGGHLALFPRAGHVVQLTIIAQESACYSRACRGQSGVLEAVVVSPPGLPELAVVVPGTTAGLAAWIESVLPQSDSGNMRRFTEWPTNDFRSYHCPGCGRIGLMPRFKPKLDGWRREAERSGSGQPDVRWAFTWPKGRIVTVNQVLADEQHAWLVQYVGQRWILRSLLE
ncbi:competence protein CoiA family protein [Deinococcus rubellus]|uniref:competence protein CoiA family protein n=1 Tax=Deinococcus rubellus TaxID=1889240 RepID=UPI0031E9FEE2